MNRSAQRSVARFALAGKETGKGTVTYTYDAADRRLSMTAGTQARTSYSYDNNNALLTEHQGRMVIAVGSVIAP